MRSHASSLRSAGRRSRPAARWVRTTSVPRRGAATFRAPDPLPRRRQAASLADLKWFEVFKDEQAASADPHGARRKTTTCATPWLASRRPAPSLGITRSNQFPNFGAGGASRSIGCRAMAPRRLPPAVLPSQNRNFGTPRCNLLSFEVDIWGRLRRATEAARANLLSAEENRKAVVTTLVSDVATAYLTLRELDYELEISQRTLQTREESLELTKIAPERRRLYAARPAPGRTTGLHRGADDSRDLQQQIEQTENQISLLLGENPGRCGARTAASPSRTCLRMFRPACRRALLERRPDIRAAEQNLIAANAEIGVARAAYFPQVEPERLPGRAEHPTVEPVQRTAQRLEPGAAGHAADLHRRTAEIQRQAGRGRAGARAGPVRENDPDRVHRSVRTR